VSNGHERGGIWALAGFLYQIVGMLSLTANISETSSFNVSRDLNEAFLFLENVGSSVSARHEHLGQDVAFVSSRGIA